MTFRFLKASENVNKLEEDHLNPLCSIQFKQCYRQFAILSGINRLPFESIRIYFSFNNYQEEIFWKFSR